MADSAREAGLGITFDPVPNHAEGLMRRVCPGVPQEPERQDAGAVFVIDDNECTRCAICVERCPSDALWLGRTSA